MNALAAVMLLAATLHAGPERAVDPPAHDAQPYAQSFRDVVAGGESALVLWQDGQYDLRAVRVDRDGRTLDAAPLPIGGGVVNPAAARGPDGWLVAWAFPGGIAARLVGDDGTLGAPVLVSADWSVSRVWVAFDGASYLVAWKHESQLAGARLDANGTIVESAFEILTLHERNVAALLPRSGGGFVLVPWLHAIEAVELDARGRFVSRRELASTPHSNGGTVAGYDAEGALVVAWLDDGGRRISVQRGDASPELLARGAEAVGNVPRAIVAAGGTTFALLERNGDVVLKDLDGGAERVWDVGYRTMTSGAASFGDRVLVVAATVPPPHDPPTTYDELGDLYAAVVDAAMQDVAPVRLLYTEPRLQSGPSIAGDVAVWLETYDEERKRRVMAKAGGGAATEVAPDASAYTKPRVATSGDGFVVTWLSHDLRPWARHVRRDGTMGEPVRLSGERIASGGQCLTWTGTEYLAAFAVVKVSSRWTFLSEVWAQPLTPDGTIAGPAVQVSGRGRIISVACASSDTTTLFAWEGERVEGAFRTHAGAVTAGFRIAEGKNPSVASNGTSFLAAWSVPIDMAVGRAIVRPAGAVETPVAIPGDLATAGVRRGGYVLVVERLRSLRAIPLDAAARATGDAIPIADQATGAELGASAVLYQRNTGSPDNPRWQVFLRSLDAGMRRRAMR